MFLANLPAPDPASFWQWLLSAAAIVGLMLAVLKLWKELRPSRPTEISPQPLQVEAFKRFATKDEVDQLSSELREDMETLEMKFARLETAVHESETRIINKGEERAKAIHERINNQSEAQAEVMQHISGQIGELAGQIKQMNLRH